jgi:1,4-dihydroxy-2-naphthoyl-CoA hydrolase
MEDLLKIKGKIEFDVVEQGPGRVVSEMPIRSEAKNPYGIVQAGAILWFADVTASILLMGSSNPSQGMAGFPLAITMNANFISNQKEGKLRAVASFVKKGRSINIVRTIISGADDRLIADVTTNHVSAK